MEIKKDISERSYNCKLCNKEYSSYKTLWSHNKKFHKDTTTHLPQNTTILPQNTTIIPSGTNNNLICLYCNKNLSRLDSLKRHINICTLKIEHEKLQEIKLEELKLIQIKEETSKINAENKNLELQIKLAKLKEIKCIRNINIISNNVNKGR